MRLVSSDVRQSMRGLPLAAVAVVAMLLAGCGGGGGGGGAAAVGSTSSSSSGSSSSSSSGSTTGGLGISGTPATTVAAGVAYSFKPAVTGATGAESFSIQNKPSWATFSVSTGQLSGTPTAAQAGTYSNVVISVSSGTASAALTAFTVTVTQTGQGSVVLSWTQPTLNADGSALTDLAGYIVKYGTSATALNQSATVPGATVTSYTVSSLNSGTYFFSVTSYTTAMVDSIPSNPATDSVP